ncbi:MAG TPA: poly(3-hydroxyalkanoate) depolymerase [Parvularcula sp.]|nr:poly(3-hydroxyalkanoate) depolymerase [Parvularcula sp.]HBS32130.1 poly(3-hydroxyalkanoate) depolymerase [Parvularcula sp.]
MSTDHLPELGFVQVEMQKLRTAVWRGTGNGTPLLFFNGIGANLEIAQPLGELLPDRDIITFDLPGIGGSPGPVTPYRPWWVAHAAKTVLLHYGFDRPVDVMGVSWGGGAAQQFAFQYQNRTRRLILCATSPGSIMVPGKIESLSKMADPRRYMDRNFLTENFKTLYGDEPSGAALFAARMTPPTRAGYVYQLMAMMGWTSLPFLPLLPHETLILAGDRDHIVPVANAKILKAMIRRAEINIFENAGHLFVLSKAREVIPVLKTFLDRPALTNKPARRFEPATA